MTAEEKWQSILDTKWPDTMPEDRILMAKFIAILEEKNGFEYGACIQREKYDDINQIVVVFPSGAQVTLCQDNYPFSCLECSNIWDDEKKLIIFSADTNIRCFLRVYWNNLFPKETT